MTEIYPLLLAGFLAVGLSELLEFDGRLANTGLCGLVFNFVDVGKDCLDIDLDVLYEFFHIL